MQGTVQVVHPATFEYLTIIAIILGPILALLAQRGLDAMREKRKKQRELYFTLMATRALWIASPEHMQAVNSIDTVFAGDKTIRELWKKCLDHLATDETRPGWSDTLVDLRVDVYQAVGNKLGYKFTTDHIKRAIYFPTAHGNTLQNQAKLLEGMSKAVENGTLRVEVVEPEKTAPPPALPVLRPYGQR